MIVDPIMTIGQKLKGDEQRDAIHFAILPCFVDEDVEYIYAGEEVGLTYGTSNIIRPKPSVYGCTPIGIVDPFLRNYDIRPSDCVWVILFPNTITGMRHHWIHPDIDNPSARSKDSDSELWLHQFADRWNFDYDEMIASAQRNSNSSFDNWITARGIDLHSGSELGTDQALFWEHLSTLTGKTFGEQHKRNFGWSCSC